MKAKGDFHILRKIGCLVYKGYRWSPSKKLISSITQYIYLDRA
jgi:hypothetical protein